jgi:hypothetical protein
MKLRNSFIAALLLLLSIQSIAGGHEKTPRVFTLDGDALALNKSKVLSKDPSVLPAYKQLIKDADKALSFGPVSVMEKNALPPSGDKHDYMSLAPYHWPDPSKPNGLPYMRKDGETNPEVKEYKDKEYFPSLCDKVYKLALAYYFSDEKKYAEHAQKLIDTWFLDSATRMNPNMNYAQAIKGVNEGRGAGLIDARHLMKVIDAIGLLKTSNAWSAAQQNGMEKWFSDFLTWMQNSRNGKDELKAANNHGIWYDALRLSIALFTNQQEQAKQIVVNAQNRLDKQMDDAGTLPLEMARTTSLHYTVFALDAFFKVAQMALKTGIDFWNYTSPTGKSLKKGFDELLPYLAKKKEWTGPQIKEFDVSESYPLLDLGYANLKCSNCKEYIKAAAADTYPRLLNNLLY